jgi:uncharacterized protein YndB with AHSA1/START domain
MTDFLETVIAKSITVQCGIDTAFRIWTEKMDLWWPKDHLVNNDPNTQIILEGRVGGRFYERTTGGAEYDWGTITIWEPPYRLAYTWNRGSTAERPTRVEVRFTAVEQNRTRVDVEHRGPEYVGELWRRTSPRYKVAWEHVLPSYASACERRE